MTIKNFTVGQTAYILQNDLRQGKHSTVIEAEVVKVGRKYVTVSRKDYRWEMRFSARWSDKPYLVEDTDMGSPNYLFPSRTAVDEYEERQELQDYICTEISWSKIERYTLEQLRNIKKILER